MTEKGEEMPDFSPGCYFDGARGRFIGEAVQTLASDYGWEGPKVTADDEGYEYSWSEAEDFLNEKAPDGYFFGSNDGGDWGLWKMEEE